MARILLQTTIVDTPDDWNVGRFSLLADQLRGDGLAPVDATAIMRFREGGGGILTARDHQDLGSCLLRLGSIGDLNHFHNGNPEPGARRDDQDNPNISWPNYHSGANGDYQPVFVDGPVHELLRTPMTPSGQIEW